MSKISISARVAACIERYIAQNGKSPHAIVMHPNTYQAFKNELGKPDTSRLFSTAIGVNIIVSGAVSEQELLALSESCLRPHNRGDIKWAIIDELGGS